MKLYSEGDDVGRIGEVRPYSHREEEENRVLEQRLVHEEVQRERESDRHRQARAVLSIEVDREARAQQPEGAQHGYRTHDERQAVEDAAALAVEKPDDVELHGGGEPTTTRRFDGIRSEESAPVIESSRRPRISPKWLGARVVAGQVNQCAASTL